MGRNDSFYIMYCTTNCEANSANYLQLKLAAVSCYSGDIFIFYTYFFMQGYEFGWWLILTYRTFKVFFYSLYVLLQAATLAAVFQKKTLNL